MTKENVKRLSTLGAAISVVGFILLFFNVNFGRSLAENWLVKQGGADTSIYLLVMEGYKDTFLAAGSILFGVGVLTLIFAYYKMLGVEE